MHYAEAESAVSFQDLILVNTSEDKAAGLDFHWNKIHQFE
jgi:hypothetical protein